MFGTDIAYRRARGLRFFKARQPHSKQGDSHNDTTETQSDSSGDIIRIHNKNLIFAALAEAVIHRVTVGKVIPTRWVGEQHIREDLGFIPSFADWMRAIRPLPWMGRGGRLEDRPSPEDRAGE